MIEYLEQLKDVLDNELMKIEDEHPQLDVPDLSAVFLVITYIMMSIKDEKYPEALGILNDLPVVIKNCCNMTNFFYKTKYSLSDFPETKTAYELFQSKIIEKIKLIENNS